MRSRIQMKLPGWPRCPIRREQKSSVWSGYKKEEMVGEFLSNSTSGGYKNY